MDLWPGYEAAERVVCQLLRDGVSPRPVPPVTVAPSLLHWNGGTILRLACGIRDEGAFEHLPVLADALEEAGCTDANLLGHLRSPGPHVPGCWAVEAIVGKV